MDEFLSLFLDGLDHRRVSVTGGGHGDAGREVNVTLSIHIPDPRAFTARDHERVAACVRRRYDGCVALDERLCYRAGQDPIQSSHYHTPETKRLLTTTPANPTIGASVPGHCVLAGGGPQSTWPATGQRRLKALPVIIAFRRGLRKVPFGTTSAARKTAAGAKSVAVRGGPRSDSQCPVR